MDYGTNSTQNAYLDGNGNLVISGLYSASGFCQYTGCPNYTSAHLKTADKFAAGPYGRIEARIQTAYASGVGQAFWSLGNDYTTGTPWPWSGELDIMEITYPTPGHNGSTVHGGETDSGNYFEYTGLSQTVDLPSGQQFNQGFHIFGVNWGPYHMTYDLDGVQYGQVDLYNLGASDVWEFQQPIYLILSLGIGAANSGTPNGTGFPANMLVDYVHVFNYTTGAPAPPTNLTATNTFSNGTTLNWTASSTSGATYNVYASTSASFKPSLSNLVADNVSGTTFTTSNLHAGTTYYYKVVAADFGGESSAAAVTVKTPGIGSAGPVKINAGGYAYQNWMADSTYDVGGNTNYHPGVSINTSGVSNPAPQVVYQTERWGPTAWTITDLNPGGVYQVRLHFAEMAHTGAGQRAFNVSINNQLVLQNFDIYQTAGAANTVTVQTFYTKANEYGIIELQTDLGTSTISGIDLNPTIEAIEINPSSSSNLVGSAPGNTTSISINSGGPDINNFFADEMFNGGDVATTTNTVNTTGAANAAPEQVYQSERYVPFTYVLTGLQAGATYNVRMHFAETYWTAAGKRIFNVSLNGAYVLTNFDVYATVGANQALVESFSTKADMYGQIIVQLLYGGADQPFINGIEAIETAGSSLPAAPTSVAATAASSSQINLSWNASSGASSYSVYRSTTGGFTPSSSNQIASGVTATSYSDTGLAASTTYYYVVEAVNSAGSSGPSPQASATTQSSGGGGGSGMVIGIDAGSSSAVSPFVADQDFSGGGTYSVTHSITIPSSLSNPAPMAVYQTARQGAITYTVPGLTANGSYTVRLHFAEPYFSASGQRQFNVAINGTQVLTNFDMVATAGAQYTANIQSFPAAANSSGQIVITFTNGAKDQPMVEGIEVDGSGSGTAPAAPTNLTAVGSSTKASANNLCGDYSMRGEWRCLDTQRTTAYAQNWQVQSFL